MKDEHVTEAVQRFYGLRLMRQDIWECLLSFVIATNANIPRISLMIRTICERFGEEVSFEGIRYRLFPTPDALSSASTEALVACGLGYRARFVKSVAETVSSGAIHLDELRLFDYARARETLIERILGKKTLLGIGRKAADCVLLFSCEKDSAFPIDVWIARVLARNYPRVIGRQNARLLNSHLAKKARLPPAAYDEITSKMRGYFGEYAGYAQQYLFHDARNQ